MTKDRDISLDWICGLLVVHMILLHISQWAKVDYVLEDILFFFMPWFFFKSGMFHKVKEERIVVKDSVRRLLVPFIVFTLLGEAVWWLRLIIAHDHIIKDYFSFLKELVMNGSIQGNMALWFLLSLFICRILFNLLSLAKINAWWIMGGFVIAATGVNYASTLAFIPYYIGNVCYGMVFYAAGYALKSVKIPIWGIIALGAAIALCSYFCQSIIDIRLNSAIKGEYIVTIPYNLAVILFINNIAKFIPSKFLESTRLHLVGRDSMSYYVMHWIIILLCDLVMVEVFNLTSGTYYWWITAVTCLLTLPFINVVLNRRFCRLIGKS